MTAKRASAEHDFGEATVTSKGQITAPNALRRALGVSPGDRLRFVQAPDGSIRLEERKRRRIVDFARPNAFRAGEAGVADYLLPEINAELRCASTAAFGVAALDSPKTFSPVP